MAMIGVFFAVAMATLPLSFESNRGQLDPQVKYVAHAKKYSVFLTAEAAAIRVAGSTSLITMKFDGANRHPEIEGINRLSGAANYLIGKDAERWQTEIPMYRRVRYGAVYPGIDVVYHADAGELEYDLIVAPGASPKTIAMTFAGAQHVSITRGGDLKLKIDGDEIYFRKPIAYQNRSGRRQQVSAEFVLSRGRRVGIRTGAYDAGQPLIIDPELSYAKYFGGTNGDGAGAVAVDRAGNTYVTGTTFSPDFPTTNAMKPDFGTTNCGVFQGAFGSRIIPCSHAYVAKLTPDGSAFAYVTFIGGARSETATGIAVDSAGNAYISGTTVSSDFPLVNPLMATGRSFILKLNPQGSALIYSTRFGGSDITSDEINAIAVDSSGHAYITGGTASKDFPLKNPVPFGSSCSTDTSAFAAKLNASGSELIYSTCLSTGGPSVGSGIAVDSNANAYITGQSPPRDLITFNAVQPSPGGGFDAFVTKLNADGALVYSTYLGGKDQDLGLAIAADAQGNAYVTGDTISDDFPIVRPLQPKLALGPIHADDAFVTKLDSAGSIVFSSYLGGTESDAAFGVTTDIEGNAYIAGRTYSADFPMKNAIQPALGGGSDAFLVKLNTSEPALLFSTYLGGRLDETARGIAANNCGAISIAGPTTLNGDAFIASIIDAPASTTEDLGGILISGPAVSSWQPDRMDAFAIGTDHALWHRYAYGASWSTWESLGGFLTSDPAAVSWAPGRIDVFARGGDNGIWHKFFAGGWSDWESLGGTVISGPAVSSWDNGRLDVFAIGADGALLHKFFYGAWAEWESLGGNLTSDPSAVSWGPGRIDVFARGGDNGIWHKFFDSNRWNEWEALGATADSAPAVSSPAPGRVDVFVMSKDNMLLQQSLTSFGATGWHALCGTFTSKPAAVSLGPNRVDLFGRGANNELRHRSMSLP